MIRWLRSLTQLGKRVDRQFEVSVRNGTPMHPPPTHFNNPHNIPKTYGDLQRSKDSVTSSFEYVQGQGTNDDSISMTLTNLNPKTKHQTQSQSHEVIRTEDQNHQHNNNNNNDFVKDLVLLATMCTLIYLTLDNYIGRIQAEKLQAETAAISARTKQLLQTRFKQQTQQRDVQILAERKKSNRRDFKMSLHIAILRQQLKELGVEPKDIDIALREFDDSVKIDTSVHNVSGQVLWLEDTSPLKEFLPDIHEYDQQGTNKE